LFWFLLFSHQSCASAIRPSHPAVSMLSPVATF
jgi:hypothetical protein